MLEMLAGPEAGSPKSQLHPVIFPEGTLDRLVKHVGFPKQTFVFVKFVTGSGFTWTSSCTPALHPELLVLRVTVYVPGAA